MVSPYCERKEIGTLIYIYRYQHIYFVGELFRLKNVVSIQINIMGLYTVCKMFQFKMENLLKIMKVEKKIQKNNNISKTQINNCSPRYSLQETLSFTLYRRSQIKNKLLGSLCSQIEVLKGF